MPDNKIKRRKYYALDVSLNAPLNIFGKSDDTDSDLLTNGEGEVFIPGTSIAGAWRDYLDQKTSDNTIFGYTAGEEGKMSRIYISDLILNNTVLEDRDNVKLDDEEKTAVPGAKFDMEIAAAGKGTLYFSFIERENDNFAFDTLIERIIQAMQDGEIRFGAKKNRGFGKLSIHTVYQAEFTQNELEPWLTFEKDEKNLKNYEALSFKEWNKGTLNEKYMHISIPLQLTGGISVRRYSTIPGNADYEHIHSNGKPVIPGSSWAGAIRHDADAILHTLAADAGVNQEWADDFMDEWFGYVDGDKAKQSKIVIGESILNGSHELINVRNRIDRFDNSTEDGALYEERMNASGSTVLSIMIRKEGSYEAAAGLIGLVMKDIEEGYLSIGGGTAIGRGIFESNASVPDTKALYTLLKEEAAE